MPRLTTKAISLAAIERGLILQGLAGGSAFDAAVRNLASKEDISCSSGGDYHCPLPSDTRLAYS